MFNNPILAKETKSILRSKKAIGLLCAYLAILALTVVVFWPTGGVLTLSAANSRQLFTYFFVGELVMILLFSPAFASTSITSEKEADSFPMLFCSLLSPMDICLGKLVSSVLFLLLLILAAMPLISVCFLLGSVTLGEMFMALVVLTVTAVTFGLMGILCSAIFDRSSKSLIVSYCVVLIVSFVFLTPNFVFNAFKIMQTPFHFMRSCSPVSAMLDVVQPRFWQTVAGQQATYDNTLLIYFAFCAILSAVSVIYVRMVLRRPPSVRTKKREDKTRKKLGFPFYIISPDRKRGHIGNWANPIFVKEFRTKFFGRITNLIRGVTACFAISLALTIVVVSSLGTLEGGADSVRVIGVIFQLGVVIFLSPVLTAGLITQEVEQRTFDMLRMSPLKSWTIIWGKLRSSYFYLIILIVASGPFFFMFAFLDNMQVTGGFESLNLTRTLYCLGMVVSAMFFGTSTGLFCSAFCKRSGAAMATSYAIMVVISVGTLIVYLISDKVPLHVVHFVVGLNPFVGTLSFVANDMLQDYHYGMQALITMWSLTGLFSILSVLRIHFMLRSRNG